MFCGLRHKRWQRCSARCAQIEVVNIEAQAITIIIQNTMQGLFEVYTVYDPLAIFRDVVLFSHAPTATVVTAVLCSGFSNCYGQFRSQDAENTFTVGFNSRAQGVELVLATSQPFWWYMT